MYLVLTIFRASSRLVFQVTTEASEQGQGKNKQTFVVNKVWFISRNKIIISERRVTNVIAKP